MTLTTANNPGIVHTGQTRATPVPKQNQKMSLSQAGVTRTLTAENAKHRKGWMRNQACHCGSGKKFKKCCGES